MGEQRLNSELSRLKTKRAERYELDVDNGEAEKQKG